MKNNWLTKIPFGIFAGASAILLFYSLLGTIVAYLILDAIAAVTTTRATLFDEWYQVLLFIGVIVGAVLFVASITMYILVKVKAVSSKKANNEKEEKVV